MNLTKLKNDWRLLVLIPLIVFLVITNVYVDPYFFDELHTDSSQRQEWMPYAEYMMGKLDGESPDVPSGRLDFFSDENKDKISTQIE